MVQVERLELSSLSALEPKSSVYTNFTTPAKIKMKAFHLLAGLDIREYANYFLPRAFTPEPFGFGSLTDYRNSVLTV